jgi:hypothetical protein
LLVNDALRPQARLLFGTALVVFVVTIVIGILNGMDIWLPERNVLLTHVHAGTLGWITLAVVGTSMLMLGEGADARALAAARRIAAVTAAAIVLYVIAFFAGTGIYRPIAGTAVLIAIVWMLAWALGRYGGVAKTNARLAIILALISLTIGAILGVLLGLFIANGSLPGLSTETASTIAEAHPPAMLIGYLILAGAAVADWVLEGPGKRWGRLIPWALFVAGLLANVAFIFDLVDQLSPIFSVLQVIAVIAFIIYMWPRIKPAAWTEGGAGNSARMSVIWLAVGIGLLVYVVQLFIAGKIDPESGEGAGILLAFDHSMFIGVMTNALFAVVGTLVAASAAHRWARWGINLGLAGFLIGLAIESSVLKRISTPIMGLALLMGIYLYLSRLSSDRGAATA